MKVGAKILESLGCPMVKPHDPAVIGFGSIPVCDGRTDGQTDAARA